MTCLNKVGKQWEKPKRRQPRKSATDISYICLFLCVYIYNRLFDMHRGEVN